MIKKIKNVIKERIKMMTGEDQPAWERNGFIFGFVPIVTSGEGDGMEIGVRWWVPEFVFDLGAAMDSTARTIFDAMNIDSSDEFQIKLTSKFAGFPFPKS